MPDRAEASALEELFAGHPELEFHAVVVLRDGQTLFERYWQPYRAEDRPLVYSVSKTFTATAVGLAIAEGFFALDDLVVELLSQGEEQTDQRVRALRVHHLLSMSTGHDSDTLESVFDAPPEEWARLILSVVPAAPVGSRHVYNNGASFLLGEILRQQTGSDIGEFLGPRVLDPMGIEATWDRDPLGRCLGWSGLHLRPSALAAFGELYRCDGVWKGQRLLPDGWVARATTGQIPTTHDSAEWRFGYGYQLWLSRSGFRLDGAFGQFALVLPAAGLVIAITSAQEDNQRMLDFVFEELVPALPPTPVELVDAVLAGPSDQPVADRVLGARWTAAGPALTSSTLGTAGVEQFNLPRLERVQAQRTVDGFELSVIADGDEVHLHCPAGQWQRQELAFPSGKVPVAVAAGVQPDGALLVAVVFTQTPHTLRLRIGATGDPGSQPALEAAWSVSPLQSARLDQLRA